MAGINYSFDARQHEPVQSVGTSHPVGKFQASISHTENVPVNNKPNSGMFVVTFTTPTGSIPFRYNLWNESPKAVEIANKQLSALCHATGIYLLDFNNEGAALRNARLMIEVGYQDKQDPQHFPEAKGYTEVKKVYDVNGNEPGKAPATQPQPQQAQPSTGAANGGGWNTGAQQGNAQQAPQGWQNNTGQQAQNPGWATGPQQQNTAPVQTQAAPPQNTQNPPWAQ